MVNPKIATNVDQSTSVYYTAQPKITTYAEIHKESLSPEYQPSVVLTDCGNICHASARPPAFLSTMPHIPSSLEGMRSHKALNGYHSLNIANDLGRNWDSHCWVCLSQSEAFLPLSLGCSDVNHEHDITLHIKGECMHTLEVLGTWSLSWRLRAL